jgi:UDP:flavonoid glycosyltransferase YjiC (YdhE family)
MEKPIVVVAAFPADGHSGGPLQISEYLVRRGFVVYFVGGSDYASRASRAGARFVAADKVSTHSGGSGVAPTTPMGTMVRILCDAFVGNVPPQFHAIKACLEDVRREHGSQRRVVIVQEFMFLGLMPFAYGAPLPEGYSKRPPILTLTTTFQSTLSGDIGPFLMGTEPVHDDEGRARIKALNESLAPDAEVLNDYADNIMAPLGVTRKVQPGGWLMDTSLRLFDATLVPHSASMDYPRSDLDPKISFIGGFPLKAVHPDTQYPPFWDVLLSNAALPTKDRKKVIFVTQGTVSFDKNKVIVPALQAMSKRKDVIVVAVLGNKGAELSDELRAQLPPNDNAFITDYLPYDALLAMADVFVFNGGFNGFMHAVMNAVPMVLAGTLGDKAEVSLRAAHAGVGINLKTMWPSADEVGRAVDQILGDQGYKQRALALRDENERLDSLGTIEKMILKWGEDAPSRNEEA